jgi:hypothetical protein
MNTLSERWSDEYERCLSCGQTAHPHNANGLCTSCYRQREAAHRKRLNRSPRDRRWSNNHACCISCGTTSARHASRGLCRPCYEGESRRRQREQTNAGIVEVGITGRVSKAELDNLYHTEGLSLSDIARRYSCTRQYILRLLNRHGIARRDKSSARSLAGCGKTRQFDKNGLP